LNSTWISRSGTTGLVGGPGDEELRAVDEPDDAAGVGDDHHVGLTVAQQILGTGGVE
jgi:hypothetical protein